MLAIIIAFIIYSQMFMEILFKTNKISMSTYFTRFPSDWPPIQIYYYDLPDRFNKDILQLFNPAKISPKHEHFMYALDVIVAQGIKNAPVITNNIKTADLVFFDYYPSYDKLLSFDWRKKKKCETKYLMKIIKRDEIPEDKWLFMHGYPYVFGSCLHLNNKPYFGGFEVRKNRTRDFVVPYFSYFPQLTVDQFRRKKFNKTISVLMAGSIRFLRGKIAEVVRTIPNSKVITTSRDETKLADFLVKVPFYYANSTFSIIARGDSPSSKRLYDAILYNSIPIIISDNFDLPYDGTLLNWSEISIKIPEKDYQLIPQYIQNLTNDKIKQYQRKLRIASERFRFDNGIKSTNGFGSIIWDIYLRYFYKNK